MAAYVVSKNLHRRHLTASQRGMIASNLANLAHGQKKADKENSLSAVSVPQAAKLLQVDQKTVSDARTVQTKGTPEEIKAVEEGKASVAAVAKQIRSGMTADERKKARERTRPKPKRGKARWRESLVNQISGLSSGPA